jgi:hypothetical protein
MGNLVEQSEWSPSIYYVEYSTPVLGGVPEFNSGIPVGGFSNVAALQLANRTKFLLDKTTEQEIAQQEQQDEIEQIKSLADAHYGSNEGHGFASDISNGFMRASDYTLLHSVQSVAFSNSYSDLLDKPPVEYTLRFNDFEARAYTRYYIKQSLTVTLPDPAFYGLVDGDFITFNKCPCALVLIVSNHAPIITSAGTTTEIDYDIDDEIIFVYDGTNWRV